MVMGVLLGLVAVNLAQDDKAALRNEAERLAQVLDVAADEARISGKSIAWAADDYGYRFLRLMPEGEWSEIRDNDVLRARKLLPGAAISELRVESTRAKDSKRLEFPAGGSMLAFSIELSLRAEHSVVAASPVGEMRVSMGKGVPNAETTPR